MSSSGGGERERAKKAFFVSFPSLPPPPPIWLQLRRGLRGSPYQKRGRRRVLFAIVTFLPPFLFVVLLFSISLSLLLSSRPANQPDVFKGAKNRRRSLFPAPFLPPFLFSYMSALIYFPPGFSMSKKLWIKIPPAFLLPSIPTWRLPRAPFSSATCVNSVVFDK